MQNAVGNNGQIIVDVIPEFELVVGMLLFPLFCNEFKLASFYSLFPLFTP